MKIGFDLDGILIDKPPFMPSSLLEWLYMGIQKNGPSYRFPKLRIETLIRILSHHHLFRPPIRENIDYIFSLKEKSHKIYLISSRYSFLKVATENILKKYNLHNVFSAVYLNKADEQPHVFKRKILKKLPLDLFVDDDIKLLEYLKVSCPKTAFLWYTPNAKRSSKVATINRLSQVQNYLGKEKIISLTPNIKTESLKPVVNIQPAILTASLKR